MGYWPSKLACILNLILQVGWGIIACILVGQMLSAINGAGLSIAVGCFIGALLIGLIATFLALVSFILLRGTYVSFVRLGSDFDWKLDMPLSLK